MPKELAGGINLGFMFLPLYRGWVIIAPAIVCLATWNVIERTKLGAYLRAATENPALVQAFGINVPRMITLTYGFGVALAALAGVMAAPIYQVSPQMGADLIIVVFAVVVIGGMGSIMGSIVTGFGLGVIEGLTKVFYPEASNTVIFIIIFFTVVQLPALLVLVIEWLCFNAIGPRFGSVDNSFDILRHSVEIGLLGALQDATAVDSPLVGLRVTGGSQNQSLDCSTTLPQLKDELAAGCGETYTVNGGTCLLSTPATSWADSMTSCPTRPSSRCAPGWRRRSDETTPGRLTT